MPELPDIEVYKEALEARVLGTRLVGARLASPFLLRTVLPPLRAAEGKAVRELRRVGKRIAIGLEGGPWLVLHLMIAGRLHWKDAAGARIAGGKRGLAAFDFAGGTLLLTEAGSQRRASLHVVEDPGQLDPGGIDPLSATPAEFAAALTAESHTLKRALTDPRVFSGIGNAYSDEILHHAKLSPAALTGKLTAEEIARLRESAGHCLRLWIARLRAEAGGGFPEGVTAFRPGMAVHGRHKLPCPDCGDAVQRIRYVNNETNYCARCQTSGRLLADRALSRLLGKGFPRSLEALEELLKSPR